MPEKMSISVNGQSKVPPGFRFHPTEEELLQYYLRKKLSFQNIDLDVIQDVDLNRLEPWDIQEKCKIGSAPQNDWYFFSHKDKKYPTGTRTNRATAAGFWKATGRDKVIFSNSRRIGMRKTLVFYKGRAPRGQKSDWIMHEYRLDDNSTDYADTNNVSDAMGETTQKEGWVVCRTFKKKNHYKTLDSPVSTTASSIKTATTRTQLMQPSSSTITSESSLEQIFQYMGRSSCKDDDDVEDEANIKGSDKLFDQRFLKLPNLESPNPSSSLYPCCQPLHIQQQMFSDINQISNYPNSVYQSSEINLNNWAALDRLVASDLNGFIDPVINNFCAPPTANINDNLQLQQIQSSTLSSTHSNKPQNTTQEYNSNSNLWSGFDVRSSLLSSNVSPLYHMSNASL